MNSSGICEDCKAEKPARLTAIGRRVAFELPAGDGFSRTEHNFAQCAVCGSIWVRTEASGADGYSRLMTCLTKAMF